jgi:hypothetical protein
MPGFLTIHNTKSISNHKPSGDFVLTIVGDGKQYAVFARFSKNLKIADQVVFTGRSFQIHRNYQIVRVQIFI